MGVNGAAVLRANPGYELVLLERFAGAARELLVDGDGDGDVYGVLRPRAGAELELRTTDADTALLFLTLGEPAPIPSYVRSRPGLDTDRAVARLVLDGVLQIEHGGEFLCGPRAAAFVLPGRSAAGSGRVGELSRAALEYAQQLASIGLPAADIAARLYAYGRRPLTPALSRLGQPGAIDAALGIAVGGAVQRALDVHWVALQTQPGEPVYWRSWRARDEPGRQRGPGYKLYVSPTVEALGSAFAAVAAAPATTRGISAFKVAAGVEGVCRPDKLVLYFDRLGDLQEAAARLRQELDGCPAQAVPFSAAVTRDGLLSWGADPPELAEGRISWRLWVTGRLAEYLVAGSAAEVEPSRFALERLRLAGIDTDTWIPADRMWAEALANA